MNYSKMLITLAAGLGMTVRLIIVSAPLGLLLGIVLGLGSVYGPRPIRWFAAIYRSMLRGIPLALQLFILYYVLPRFGILLTPFTAAALGFALCSGAYHSEYIRSALLSIPSGQAEAGRSLGMSRLMMIRTIILPQAMRRALPGCGNELTYLIKYSSLAYLVTLVDVTGAGRLQAYASFRFFEVFVYVGLLYLGLVAVARAGLYLLRRRWRRSSGGLLRAD